MAKDTTELPVKRNFDTGNTSQNLAKLYLVDKDKTYAIDDNKKKEITDGKVIRSKAVHRVEVTVSGCHVIFEPLSSGPIPEEILNRKGFRESLGKFLVEVK